jgi:DNA-directed RNA polymerase subunit E'/Rpb7
MFFLKTIKKEILLEPRFLGPLLMHHVFSRLTTELEGQCYGKLGYIISVMKVEEKDLIADNALVDNDNGSVNLTCVCQVLVLRPFKNEVVDAVVTMADNPTGIFTNIGPLKIYVSRYAMPKSISFDENSGNRWVAEDGRTEITVGTVLRLRITGSAFKTGEISAVGKIDEDCLGVVGTAE